jgi:hypothetical protein
VLTLVLAGILVAHSRERGWAGFWEVAWPRLRVWVVGVLTPVDELVALLVEGLLSPMVLLLL